MKLVVGLGNPGKKYAATRHNVGFRVLAELARRHGMGAPRAKFHGEVVDAIIHGVRGSLLCPQTYMNNSGRSVLAARDFFKTADTDLLIVCDDVNLPLGRLRVRAKGSSGGQKGLQDVIRRLGTENIARLRIGVGTPPDGWDVSDYVLSKFDPQEQPIIEDAVLRAADAVATWVDQGIETCMNQFNAIA